MVLVMISSTTYDVISFNRLHSIKLQSICCDDEDERERKHRGHHKKQQCGWRRMKPPRTTYV